MKSIIVTGAGRGLGLAVSRRLLAESYRVVAVSRTYSDALRQLASEHGDSRLAFVPIDFNLPEALNKGAAEAIKAAVVPYGLINNAATGLDGFLGTMHPSQIREVLRVNLESPILFTKLVSRQMIPHKQGRVISISSIIARTGFSGLSVYAATKAGLEGFTRSLARELGPARITVNCIAPGYMETDMTSGIAGTQLESIRRRAPLGLAAVQDVAAAVSFLLSDSAGMITGTSIVVDGGSTA